MSICTESTSGLLSGLLAFLFITAGVFKLTPKLSVEAHERVYRDFVQYSKLHPVTKFGYEIEPKKFMTQIGIIEVIAGMFLVLGPRVTRIISCLCLASLMVGALYLANLGNRPTEDFIIHGFLLFLCFLRLNMFFSPTFTPSVKTNRTAATTSTPTATTTTTTTAATKSATKSTKTATTTTTTTAATTTAATKSATKSTKTTKTSSTTTKSGKKKGKKENKKNK